MATTQNTFTGNGSNLGPFSFTFKWLEPTDIKVTVAGVLKTAGTHYNLQSLNYSTKTGGQVLFTAGNAPANGAAIIVYRQTDDTDLAATFYSGSAIRAQDLNNNFIQGLYVTQEASNNAAAATSTVNTATSTANTALSNSTAAQASAASAVSTANAASSTAASAVSTANSASAAAASAVSTANVASSNAATAVITANTALNAISEVLNYSAVNAVANIPTTPSNGQAIRVVNSTGIESFTPLSGLPGGFVGSSALSVEIFYDSLNSTWVWTRYFPVDPENRYEAADPTILKDADIGVTVQAYDTTILKAANLGVTVQPYDATILKAANLGVTVQAYDANTAKRNQAQTFTGLQTFGSGVDVSGRYAQTPVSMGSMTVDCSNGNYFTRTVSSSSSFAVSNVPASRAYGFVLQVLHQAGTITWFPNVVWPKGTAPTLTTGKTHLFVFVTSDGGATWRGSSLVDYNA